MGMTKKIFAFIACQHRFGCWQAFINCWLEDPKRLKANQINRINFEAGFVLMLADVKSKGCQEAINVS